MAALSLQTGQEVACRSDMIFQARHDFQGVLGRLHFQSLIEPRDSNGFEPTWDDMNMQRELVESSFTIFLALFPFVSCQ